MSPFDVVYEKLSDLYTANSNEDVIKYIDDLNKKEIYNPWCSVFCGLCALQNNKESVKYAVSAIIESYKGAAVTYGKGTDFISFVAESSNRYLDAIEPILVYCSDKTQKIFEMGERESEAIESQAQFAATRMTGYEFVRYKNDMLDRISVIDKETRKAAKPFNDIMSECLKGNIMLFEACSDVMADYASFDKEDYEMLWELVQGYEESTINPIREFTNGPFASTVSFFDKHKRNISNCINEKEKYEKELAEKKYKQQVAEYWRTRQPELDELNAKKEGMVNEQKELEKQIDEVQRAINGIADEKNTLTPGEFEIVNLNNSISELEKKYKSLGLFSISEKKRIKHDIEEIENHIVSLSITATSERENMDAEIDRRIDEKKKEKDFLRDKLTEVYRKIDEIMNLINYPIMR